MTTAHSSFPPIMNATNGRAIVEAMNGLADNNNTRLRCCCGRPDCAFLEHNNTALGGLEKDLETAARLGKALLSRHESYITESQAEHARLSTYVTELEVERASLQTANEKIVAENRELLIRLETLNTNLATGDDDIKRLEDLLLDCELEVKRLNGLVRQTGDLDGRLQEMERERIVLNQQIEEGHEDIRNTMARWRDSERRVRELEEDLKRIEREARLDRERHEDIVARLERERVVDKELSSAKGRLKGGAAIQGMKTNGTGAKNVVSHFVKDILQDNANLQAGIEELRELLQASNDEVQNLREQIMLHQPLDEQECEESPHKVSSLEEQMAQTSPKQLQQEVHVHHHYHAKLAKRDKPTPVKRPSRRRAVMPAYGYSSDASAPSTPLSRPQRYMTSPGPMSLYHPQPSKNRWSVQSTATNSTFLSSISSSPRSYFDRSSSLFDRLERGEESSRPTSPESISESPLITQRFPQKTIDHGMRTSDSEVTDEVDNMPPLEEEEESISNVPYIQHSIKQIDLPEHDLTPKPSLMLQNAIGDGLGLGPLIPNDLEPRPPDGEIRIEKTTLSTEQCPVNTSKEMPEIRPSLTRRGSHESLVSISGMDIHIAKRPSPANTLTLLRGNSAYFAQTPSQARKVSASQPLASVTEYTVLSSTGLESSLVSAHSGQRRSSGIEALSGIAVPPSRNMRGTSPSSGGLTRLVGGWVRSKWGIAPTRSVTDLRSASAHQAVVRTVQSRLPNLDGLSAGTVPSNLDYSAAVSTTGLTNKLGRPKPQHIQTAPSTMQRSQVANIAPVNDSVVSDATIAASGHFGEVGRPSFDISTLFAGRAPGINQPGAIPGFRAAAMSKRTPSEVQTSVIDEEGLRDCLAE